MCRCVVCRSGSVPLFYNILALAQKPSVFTPTPDNCKLQCVWKFMKWMVLSLRKCLKILVGGGTLKGVLIWEGTVNSYILGNNCKQTFLIH